MLKRNIKTLFIVSLQLLFYFCVFLMTDIILMYFIGGSSTGLRHIVAMDFAIGLIFSVILSYTDGTIKKVLYVIFNIAVTLYAIFVFIEITLKMSFDTFYTLETILYNMRSVVAEYGSEVRNIIISRGLMVLLLLLIVVFTFYTSKILYFDEKIMLREGSRMKRTIKLSLCIFVIVFTAFTGVFASRGDLNDFTELMMNEGIKSAVYHEYTKSENLTFELHNDNQVAINPPNEVIEVVAEETTKVSEGETVEMPVEETIEALSEEETEIATKDKVVNANAVNVTNTNVANINTDVSSFVLNRVATGKNAYTGLFKGKNLIMICAEALNTVIVDENLFPTLYRLINNGFKFNHFYQQKEGSTSSGEFAFMTGLIPRYNDRSFMQSIKNNMGFTVPSMLHNEGYSTYSFHNGISTFYNRDKTHGKFMGFDVFMANDTGLTKLSGSKYPSDFELFKYTYDLIPKDRPFCAHYMTYSGHMPYTNYTTSKRYKLVDAYYGNTKSEPVKTYIAKNMILEEGLTYLLNSLEASGLLDDTVICIVPDHYPYGLYNANAVTGEKKNYVAELYNDPEINSHPMLRDRTDLIIWSGCLENKDKDKAIEVNKICSTIDVTPTLLNLFGVTFDSRIYPGRDIFSDEEGIVIYNNGKYIAIGDVNSDGSINNDEVLKHQLYARNVLNYCTYFIKNDYYGQLAGTK